MTPGEAIWATVREILKQLRFKSLKTVVIASAASIPFLAGLTTVPRWLTGALGMLIAITEGVQQLNQYHATWISSARLVRRCAAKPA